MIRKCASCGTSNRIPAVHLSDTGKCGKCKDVLPPVDKPIDVGVEEFQEVVTGAKVPVLVDFWAAWCGPCKLAAPEVELVAKSMKGRAIVLKVDTEGVPELARRFRVRGIPFFVVMKNAEVFFEQAGLVDHQQMEKWLERAGA